MKRKVAICQVSPVRGDLEGNTKKILKWMQKAAEFDADVALFGELFLTDYDLDEDGRKLSQLRNGPIIKAISEAAKKFRIAVAFGYSEVDEEGKFYNSLLFVDGNGEVLGNYRKVHLWPTETASGFASGDEMVVFDWDGVRVGLAICVDICMSEFVTTMVADCGAQLILVANALVEKPRYERSPLMIVPSRALENRCYVAYADLGGEKYSGMSRICSPEGECLAAVTHAVEDTLLTAVISTDAIESASLHYHELRRTAVYRKYIT